MASRDAARTRLGEPRLTKRMLGQPAKAQWPAKPPAYDGIPIENAWVGPNAPVGPERQIKILIGTPGITLARAAPKKIARTTLEKISCPPRPAEDGFGEDLQALPG